ncbi:hypothetical protein O181_089190, partial [Austropuccinia psidii MF-1]|nr:hypothetical protein [Austropuccinia psidii MF-1]
HLGVTIPLICNRVCFNLMVLKKLFIALKVVKRLYVILNQLLMVKIPSSYFRLNYLSFTT